MTATLQKIVANFQTSLAVKVANGATTGTLSGATDKNGVALPTGTYTMVCEPGTANEEHLRFTLTGTAMTAIYSISRQGTATSGVQATSGHRAGSVMILTDFNTIKLHNDLLSGAAGFDSLVPLNYDGAPTFSTGNQIVTKTYVDGVAVAGASDANTTTKGIVEEATEAEINAATAAGGTSARLFVNPSTLATSNFGTRLPSSDEKAALVGTSGSPSTSNKFVTADDVAENTASKAVRRKSDSNVTVPTTPTATTDASSKAYADTKDFYSKCGATTVTNSTGTQNIAHGGGSTPKHVRLTTIGGGTGSGGYSIAFGAYNGSATGGIYAITSGSSGWTYSAGNGTTNVLTINDGNNNGNTLTVTVTVDATNIILSTTKASSGATANLLWEAFFQD